MAALSLLKSIEATRLNKRSGLAMPGPPVTISFGALVEFVASDRSYTRFQYLGDLFRCDTVVWESSTPRESDLPARSKPVETRPAEVLPATPAPIASRAPAPPPTAEVLVWETLECDPPQVMSRAKVPGGWLILVEGCSVAYYPDPGHHWNGKSLL